MRLRKFQSFAPGAVLVHRTPVFMVCMGSYDHKPQFKSGVVPKIVCQLLSKVFSADRRGVPGDLLNESRRLHDRVAHVARTENPENSHL